MSQKKNVTRRKKKNIEKVMENNTLDKEFKLDKIHLLFISLIIVMIVSVNVFIWGFEKMKQDAVLADDVFSDGEENKIDYKSLYDRGGLLCEKSRINIHDVCYVKSEFGFLVNFSNDEYGGMIYDETGGAIYSDFVLKIMTDDDQIDTELKSMSRPDTEDSSTRSASYFFETTLAIHSINPWIKMEKMKSPSEMITLKEAEKKNGFSASFNCSVSGENRDECIPKAITITPIILDYHEAIGRYLCSQKEILIDNLIECKV